MCRAFEPVEPLAEKWLPHTILPSNSSRKVSDLIFRGLLVQKCHISFTKNSRCEIEEKKVSYQ